MSDHPQRELARVSAALFRQPMAISDEGMELLESIIALHKAGGVSAEEVASFVRSPRRYNVQSGVALVPINGPIFRKAGLMDMSGATSMEQLRGNLGLAMDEAKKGNVRSILLSVDSPGGEVVGLEETAAAIAKISAGYIPIIAHTEGTMASAAYWLSSQADEIVSTPDSIVGSIGILIQAEDTTRSERNAGRDRIVLKTGENKAIGVGPITDKQLDVFRGLQAQAFAVFTKAVETGRRMKLDEDVLSGRIFSGQDAKAHGLVDRHSTFSDLLKSMQS